MKIILVLNNLDMSWYAVKQPNQTKPNIYREEMLHGEQVFGGQIDHYLWLIWNQNLWRLASELVII